MRRRVKVLAVLLGVPALLALVAAVVLPMLADAKVYKRQATALVKAHTGLDLHIDGRVRLHVLPRLRVTVSDVRLDNPPGFGSADLARLPWLAVDLAPLALLAGRIEPHAIVASGLTLNLERDREGRGNWEIATDAEQGGTAKRAGITDSPLAAMAAGTFELRDATLHWRDHTRDETITVPSINLETSALDVNGRIDTVRLQVTLPGGTARIEARGEATLTAAGDGFTMPDVTATFRDLRLGDMRLDGTLNTRLTADFAEQRLNLDSLRVSGRAEAGDDRQMTVAITTGLDFDLARQRLEPNALTVTIPAYSLAGYTGDVQLGGRLSGDLRAGTYAIENLQGSGNAGAEGAAEPSVAFTLGGALEADLERQRFSAPGLEISGSVDGDRLPFRFAADLDVSPRTRTLDAAGLHVSIRDWRIDGATGVRVATSPPGVQGVLDVRIQDQPLAGSFAVTRAQANADGLDVRFDVVADLDIVDTEYVLRGRNAMVLRARVLPASAIGAWQVEDLELGVRMTDASFADGDVIIRVQADLEVNTNDQFVRTENLRVALDDSRIVGHVRVRGFDKPAVHIELEADTIDADRYLLPAAARTTQATPATPVAASIDAIRALDVTGEVRVRSLTLEGVQMQDVRLVSSGNTSTTNGNR